MPRANKLTKQEQVAVCCDGDQLDNHIQRIQTRGHLSPDARPLKRSPKSHRQSGGEKGGSSVPITLHADVYPQQEKQEEDNLGPERLARGYQIEVIHRSLVAHEYDTIMKTSNVRFFTNNEQFSKAATLIKQIVQKKNEMNTVFLDKNWLKDNMLRSFKEGIRSEFFESLATGRRLQIKDKRLSLNSSFPKFIRVTIDRLTSLSPQKVSFPLCEAMDLLFEKGVPVQRAIWFFKMNQIAHLLTFPNKPKKGTLVMPCEDYASDQRQFFVRYLRCVLKEFDKAIPGQLEQNIYYQKWPYTVTLIKHSFEDGMLDRHEFVNDLCDLLPEFANFSMEQPQTFRALLILISQFVDVITQNIFIARKVAHVLCVRLNQYRRDYELIRGASTLEVPAGECFEDLTNCHHHRPTLLTMFGMIHAILIDCPSALPDKSGNSSKLIERESAQNNVAWLCKSPLDQLPCELSVTTQHLAAHAKAQVDQILNIRIEEIKQRSQAIEDRWVHISPSNTRSGLDSIVESCLDILSFLDTVDLGAVDALLVLYNNIFGEDNDCLDITIRVLIYWAVTVEREGSHRGLIIAHLLRMHVHFAQKDGKKLPFGDGFPFLQDLLVDCLNKDWAQPTGKAATNLAFWTAEFANLMLLFYELQRFGLFNHDKYVKALMRDGTLDSRGLFSRLNLNALSVTSGNKSASLSADERANRKPNSLATVQGLPPAQSQPETNVKQEHQMIISFIPMSKPTPPSLNTSVEQQSNNNLSSVQHGGTSQTPKQMEEFAKLPPQFETDNHPFLNESSELSFAERFIVHLPVEQIESNRDVCNQRAIVLYGISEQRDNARQELRKIAREICKAWKKKTFELTTAPHCQPNSVQPEVRYKRRCTPEQLSELMGRFNVQTYYDQLVICGWCAESFLDSVEEFVRQAGELAQEGGAGGTQIVNVSVPAQECLDMLCTMMTICRSINSIITLAQELMPLLIHLRWILKNQLHVDHFSASVSAQYAFVLVSHLAEHFFYLLYSPEACSIINDLYRLVENELGAPIRRKENGEGTGWSRAVAIFVYHARHHLLVSKLNVRGSGPDDIVQLLGRCEEFEAVFPPSGGGSVAANLEYHQQLTDDPSRMSFNDLRNFFNQSYKRLAHSMRNDSVRYSFVIDAFKTAVSCDRNYDRLIELANFCANISANWNLTTEWCNAIQELCYPSASSGDWKELIQDIDATKFSTHYAIATFTLLLASKYCFSTHGLICRLIANVLSPLLSKQEERNENMTMAHRKTDDFGGHDNNFCLTLYICACLCCGTDEPFQYCENNSKSSATSVSVFSRDANKMALRIVHLVELETSIFPLLCVVVQLVDGLKRKVEARKDAVHFRIAQNYLVARCALLSICEQEWVIQRMFCLCDSHDELEMFTNSDRLRNHYVGQQLLRWSLRRKSERSIKQELIEHTGDKKVYERLLSTLSVWNMRATYYDFKLNILEQNPDNQPAKTSNGNQQLASSYQMVMYQQALFNNVANACHLLFKEHLLKGNHCEDLTTVQNFCLTAINCHWLIAPLVNALPSPSPPTTGNPQNTLWCPWNSSAMKAYLLKVVADNLSSTNTERTVQYEQLLGYQPFLNLVLSCTEGEEIKQLLDSLLFYIDDIVKRVKKNAVVPYQNSFFPERDGLILRLNLISGLFDSLLANNNVDLWASAFFQMLYYEIVTDERDRDYFDTCYDMLLMLCFRIYPHKMYTNFIAKFKNLRIPDELYCLQQLLPVAKSQSELSAWGSFKNLINKPIPMAGKGSGGGSTAHFSQQSPITVPNKPKISGIIVDKQTISLQKQMLRVLRHQHWLQKHHSSPKGDLLVSFIPRPGVVGESDISGRNNANLFLAAPEMEQVAALALEEVPSDVLQRQQIQIMQQHQQQQQVVRQQQQQQNTLMVEQQQQQNHHQQMFTQQQQQQIQQPNLMTQMNVVQPPQQQQFSQHQQQMFQPQQQHLVPLHGMLAEGLPGMTTSQQASVRSGSSTPATDSPKTGAGRGGRRKNAAAVSGTNQMQSTGAVVATTGAGRGQKRKKEPKQPQLQQQQSNLGGTEMFRGGQQSGSMIPSQMGGQSSMNQAAMIMQQQQQQQQQMTAQFQQQQQWQQQMQRQQQPMMGNAMMFSAQQQPMPAQAVLPLPTTAAQFRPQQMQTSQQHLQQLHQFPPLHQQQQHQQMRPNHQPQPQFPHPQMMQGMPQPPPAQQQQQQIPQMQHHSQIGGGDQQQQKSNSSNRSVIQQRLMLRVQSQQNQVQQQQHMGMPPQQ
uniref:Mediator complex subunit Med12 LCEWAV-domain domain-containing protein n=1 Tax=Globodera rostochiensis TaxID=31243 RepID=A0A914IAX6_GLORO